MVSRNFSILAFLVVLTFSYAASRAVLSESDLAELGCNPFSGWQTCVGKRIAESLEADDIEDMAKNIARKESSSIDDVNKYERLIKSEDAEDRSTQERLVKAFFQFLRQKSTDDKK